MKEIQLSHFYTWKDVPDTLVPQVMQEFADNGAQNLVLVERWVERMIRERVDL